MLRDCELEKQLKSEVKAEKKKIADDYEKAERAKARKEKREAKNQDYCMGCDELRPLSEDGYCRKCEAESDI
jgi:hypothetical protein